MSQVTFIDSTALGHLVQATHERVVIISNPSERVRGILAISGLDERFTIKDMSESGTDHPGRASGSARGASDSATTAASRLVGADVEFGMLADARGDRLNDAMKLAESFAEVARALLAESGVDETLQLIVDTAVRTIPGCEHAGISLLARRRITTRAASDDIPRQVDSIQYQTDQGPCLDAIREHEVFVTDDLRRESRWPEFSERATRATGVRSMLALRLFEDEHTLGALNLYSKRQAAFNDGSRVLGGVLAAHAAVAIAGSQREENLQTALETRDRIGQAKGILMGQRAITADQAFELIRQLSQERNIKLIDLADEVIWTGQLPQ